MPILPCRRAFETGNQESQGSVNCGIQITTDHKARLITATENQNRKQRRNPGSNQTVSNKRLAFLACRRGIAQRGKVATEGWFLRPFSRRCEDSSPSISASQAEFHCGIESRSRDASNWTVRLSDGKRCFFGPRAQPSSKPREMVTPIIKGPTARPFIKLALSN